MKIVIIMSYPCGKYEQITPSRPLKVLIILTLDTAYQTKKNHVISTLVQQQLDIKFGKNLYNFVSRAVAAFVSARLGHNIKARGYDDQK